MKRHWCWLVVLGIGLVAGCQEESRWEAAQQQSAADPNAVSEAALPGSAFNKYFPEQGDGIDIVFKQEKDGFAQANLLRGGDLIAILSISDTRNNPSARDKFSAVTEKVADYPIVARENTTSALVADRFQVQVQSEGEKLTAEDRATWLSKFDLAGLATAF